MIKKLVSFALILSLPFQNAYARAQHQPPVTEPIPVSTLTDFHHYPTVVRNLIKNAEKLSQQNLTYQYGSADPKNGGMDCSGTIYHLLMMENLKDVPRDSSGMYVWAEKEGVLHKVTENNFTSGEFAHLKPGDLLFWSGTYAIKRYPPITHVMIYLGKDVNNKPLIFGASDGRSYRGKRMWGVSVFDFQLSSQRSGATFVGYSCIPHLTCGIKW